MPRYLLALALVPFAATSTPACWNAIDPTAYAQICPIIIRGKIVAIAEAPPGGERLDDQASIQVEEIEKNVLKDVGLRVGDVFTVRMISRNNRSQSSTDLNYPLGTNATWMVHLNTGGEFRIDLHPVQKQSDPGHKGGKIGHAREAFKERGRGDDTVADANPRGTVTKREWIEQLKKEQARRQRAEEKRLAAEKERRAIALELASVERLTPGAFRRYHEADPDTRRDIFQLRDQEQPLKGDRLVDVVEEILKSEKDPNIRTFAANAIAYARNPGMRGNAVLAAALSDPHEDVRMFVCQALWIRDAREQVFAVLPLFTDRSAQVRDMAVTTMAHFVINQGATTFEFLRQPVRASGRTR